MCSTRRRPKRFLSDRKVAVLEFKEQARDKLICAALALDHFVAPDRISVTPRPRADPRWRLLSDLRAAAYPGRDDEEWSPVTIVGRGYPDDGMEEEGVYDFLQHPIVQVEFDARMTLESLIAALRGVWSEIVEAKLLTGTYSLEEKADSIVRLVCIDHADSNWAERLQAWNAQHAEREDWVYDSVKNLQNEFYRQEEQLVGRRHGLRWMWDRDWFKARGTAEAMLLASWGVPHARRALLENPPSAGVRKGLRFGPEPTKRLQQATQTERKKLREIRKEFGPEPEFEPEPLDWPEEGAETPTDAAERPNTRTPLLRFLVRLFGLFRR